MTKLLSATKCKDGYLVKITTSLPADSLDDVLNIIRYEGLEVKKQFSTKNEKGEQIRIYAE